MRVPGQAVAAVAATNAHVAREALSLIEVEYEPLPPVLDVREAMRPEAPLIKETQRTKSMAGSRRTRASRSHMHLRAGRCRGGVRKGRRDRRARIPYSQMVHQGYIEPHASTAYWNNDGNVTMWTTTQGAFPVRQQVCDIVGLPPCEGQGRPDRDRWRLRR